MEGNLNLLKLRQKNIFKKFCDAGQLKKQDHSFPLQLTAPVVKHVCHQYVCLTVLLQSSTLHHTKAASRYIQTPSHPTTIHSVVNTSMTDIGQYNHSFSCYIINQSPFASQQKIYHSVVNILVNRFPHLKTGSKGFSKGVMDNK